MKKVLYSVLAAAAAGMLVLACGRTATSPAPTGQAAEGPSWLFLDGGPYTLTTQVETAGEADVKIVTDVSLMLETPDIVLSTTTEIGPDSTMVLPLGDLAPGFYQVRVNDSIRFNIGIRPDEVVSPADAADDFDAFWEATLAELAAIPMEPTLTPVPEYSNQTRTCYEVRYPAWGGAVSGGIVSIPNADGKYPVRIQYMGYGAEPFYFDPDSAPERIDFLVSVRDQGIFKNGQDRWIDRGIASKETFYYRGAFCDVKQAVDFVASLEKADTENIVALGESQGGAFTVLSAALDKRIRAIAPAVPFLGDYPDYWKIVWWPLHEVFETADAEGIDRDDLLGMLTYFDIKNFAPRVTCPVYMAFGLQDPTCPPHTNFAIYNLLASKEKHFWCVPTCGHAMWLEPSWPPVREAFLNEE